MMHGHRDSSDDVLEQVRSLASAGNLSEAFRLLTFMQQQYPENHLGWSLGCALLADCRDWGRLRQLARQWLNRHPESLEAWQHLARAAFEVSDFDAAIASCHQMIQLEPENPQHWVTLGKIATADQQYDLALSCLERARIRIPESVALNYALCRVYYLTGELAMAEQICRRILAIEPGFVPAYTTLGQLREGRLAPDDISAMEHLLATEPLHPEYRALLCFTLGDALDRQQRYDAAFEAWQQGNHINSAISAREGIAYDATTFESDVALLSEIFNESLSVDVSASSAELMPIFVVGMPRSCTTLVESILASHSTVSGAGELPALDNVYELMMTHARREGATSARDFIRHHAQAWREHYLRAIAGNSPTRRIVDKQPLNFRAIGLIRLLFPDSPIIYTVRDPVDVGLSIYRHNFSKNWPCAHRLEDIGHYYGVHERIMALWLQRYPTLIHTVHHAQLLRDPTQTITGLLDFAGLAFEPACLTPHLHSRAIATFSAVQVRQPISQSYAGKSRHYSTQLTPLIQALNVSGVLR
jgi:tetratricopeptide (TPR) repeat protein